VDEIIEKFHIFVNIRSTTSLGSAAW
jgi:hypothetical protein